MPSPRPNLFLIGAPRCGTTSIAGWLRAHPAVFMTERKEQWYFSRDIRAGMALGAEAQYLAQFSGATPSHRWRGEASTVYMMSREAAANIIRFNPDARLIAAVRNPVEMAASFHRHLHSTGVEPVADFERAWRLQPQRARGEKLPARLPDPLFLQYRQVAALGTQLARVLEHVPREQLHVVVFDDLAGDTLTTYRSLMSFLQLDGSDPPDLAPRNRARSARFPALSRVIHRYRRPLHVVNRAVRRLVPSLPSPGEILTRANQQPHPRPALRPEFRAGLDDEFAGEINLLCDLLGRDPSTLSR